MLAGLLEPQRAAAPARWNGAWRRSGLSQKIDSEEERVRLRDIIQLFMSENAARKLQEILAQPMWGFIGILLAWNFFGKVLWPARDIALNVLYPGMFH